MGQKQSAKWVKNGRRKQGGLVEEKDGWQVRCRTLIGMGIDPGKASRLDYWTDRDAAKTLAKRTAPV